MRRGILVVLLLLAPVAAADSVSRDRVGALAYQEWDAWTLVHGGGPLTLTVTWPTLLRDFDLALVTTTVFDAKCGPGSACPLNPPDIVAETTGCDGLVTRQDQVALPALPAGSYVVIVKGKVAATTTYTLTSSIGSFAFKRGIDSVRLDTNAVCGLVR